jgi:ufm1-conjugating enzyme 1
MSAVVPPSSSGSPSGLPLFTSTSTPLESGWEARLREEYVALIEYSKQAKEKQTDWFRIKASDPQGLKWEGTCWQYVNHERFEFDFVLELPASYPAAPPDIFLPYFEGKTPKMYRGGRICLDIHFQPLWIKNAPKFGIIHALALGLSPWLAAEIPVVFPPLPPTTTSAN